MQFGITPVALLACLSCSSPEGTAAGDFSEELVCYDGRVRVAERQGDVLVVEGDLEVTEQEQWCAEELEPSSSPGLRLQGRRAPAEPGSVWGTGTYGKYWPGVVPYVIDAAFTSTARANILAAMDDWHDVAPGITFREKTASDTSWVNFVLDTVCQSGYGRISGARTIRLSSGCTMNFSVHHEIGHALGLQHEHTRSDRDDYVVVSSSDSNYEIDSGADMFSYDFDSVMHYSLGGFISLESGVVLPPGVTPGQRTHLSVTDIATVRAMYPEASIQPILFADTGQQRACNLMGRETDLVTEFELDSSPSALDASSAIVDTSGLTEGDYNVTCVADSLFWARDYDYPNTTYDESVSSADPAEVQSYQVTGTVRVLNPGLLAVLL
jgi:hypothetical protein